MPVLTTLTSFDNSSAELGFSIGDCRWLLNNTTAKQESTNIWTNTWKHGGFQACHSSMYHQMQYLKNHPPSNAMGFLWHSLRPWVSSHHEDQCASLRYQAIALEKTTCVYIYAYVHAYINIFTVFSTIYIYICVALWTANSSIFWGPRISSASMATWPWGIWNMCGGHGMRRIVKHQIGRTYKTNVTYVIFAIEN